jgi:hypothetical protein
MQIFQRSKERTMSELHPGSKERTMSELHPEKEAEIQRTIAEGFAAPATPASELPQWAIEEAYAIVTEHSWGWPENASDELTDDQEQHCTDLAASLVQIVGRYKAQPPDAEANAALALEIRRLAEVEAGAAELRAACEESRAFIGIMFGCGPDAVIPTTVVTPLGVPVKLAEVFQRLDAALQPSPVTNRAIEILGGGE